MFDVIIRTLKKVFFDPLVLLPLVTLSLLKRWNDLKLYDTLIFCEEGGFGHSAIVPDVCRILFGEKKAALLFFFEHRRHNKRLAAIWMNPHVITIPIEFPIPYTKYTLSGSPAFRHWGTAWVLKLLRIASPHARVLSLLQAYEEIPRSHKLESIIGTLPLNFRWPMYYFDCLKSPETRRSVIQFPEEWRQTISQAIKAHTRISRQYQKRCGLYLRQKHLCSPDKNNTVRNGSQLGAYLSSIRLLNEKGYQVYVTGDQRIPRHVFNEFQGGLIDPENINVEKSIFDLFAALEVDLYIGETGGGIWLPGVRRIPRLLLNAFPYFHGYPQSWSYFKTVWDNQGKLVDPKIIFEKHAYSFDLPGMEIRSNSEEEIFAAVSSFLEDIKLPWSDASLPDYVPENTWIKQCGGKISPAFLAKYRN